MCPLKRPEQLEEEEESWQLKARQTPLVSVCVCVCVCVCGGIKVSREPRCAGRHIVASWIQIGGLELEAINYMLTQSGAFRRESERLGG